RQAREHPGAGRGLRLAGELAELGRALGNTELVAHPFQHRPRREDASVERVLELAVDAPGDGGKQASGGLRDLRADVGEHEHTGAVGRLDPAGYDARRTGQGRLLVDRLAAERKLDRPALMSES